MSVLYISVFEKAQFLNIRTKSIKPRRKQECVSQCRCWRVHDICICTGDPVAGMASKAVFHISPRWRWKDPWWETKGPRAVLEDEFSGPEGWGGGGADPHWEPEYDVHNEGRIKASPRESNQSSFEEKPPKLLKKKEPQGRSVEILPLLSPFILFDNRSP